MSNSGHKNVFSVLSDKGNIRRKFCKFISYEYLFSNYILWFIQLWFRLSNEVYYRSILIQDLKVEKISIKKIKKFCCFFSRKFFNCRITKMRFPVIWKKRAQRICHWQYFINFVLCYLSFFFLRFIPENGGTKAPSVLLHSLRGP